MSSIKILEKGDLEMFQVDEHVGVLGECQTQKALCSPTQIHALLYA